MNEPVLPNFMLLIKSNTLLIFTATPVIPTWLFFLSKTLQLTNTVKVFSSILSKSTFNGQVYGSFKVLGSQESSPSGFKGEALTPSE